VLGDEERSSTYAAEQRRLVRAAVAAEVLAFTPYWRDVIAETGLAPPKAVADLQGLAPRPLDALGPPDTLVLRPSPEAVRKSGPRPLRRRLRRARLRRGHAMRGILDPLYKPIHWIIENETPVGCTEADLLRLAELGSRSLGLAGVTPGDAIVGLVPPGPSLSTWQLALGAREAGIPLAGLAPDTSLEAVAMLGPTVLAGRPSDLLRVLRGLDETIRADITTVMAVTRSPLAAKDRRALTAAVGDQAAVVESWSPPGVRALWTQCRGGEGVHTWPQAELVEVCGPDDNPVAPGDEGQLVWTGLGWRGTVLVRLATGMLGRLVEGTCPCGRTTPRILDARPLADAVAARGRRRRIEEPAESHDPFEPRPAVDALEPVEGREPLDEAELVVGPVKATGGVESVRTVRLPRKARAAARAAAAEAPPSSAVSAEELPGTVRAVAKEDEPSPPVRPQSPLPPRPRTPIGDVGHLPPRPEVGPDAGGDGSGASVSDPWLPDTGEVDAWPAPVLASTEGLAAWQVEHRRRRGHDELVVHLALAEGAELGAVLVSLERAIGATQYVVSSEDEIGARVAAADGRRVVDRRNRSGNGGGSGRRNGNGGGAGNGANGGGNGGGNGGNGGVGARSATPERRAVRKR
jgi:uncharacterized membrane protein YgcG